ncbi:MULTISPECIES: plastocyanin/azurin family copper-binding protein [unclassified Blastococcus]
MTRPTGPTRRARRLGVGLLAAALCLLSACGDDDDGGDGGGGSAAETSQSETSASETAASSAPAGSSAPASGSEQAGGTLEVTSVDFSYELPSEEMAAGEYTIDLTNGGNATHDLVVERDGEDVAATDQIGPGQTSSLTVTLEPGEYVFYCSVGNHRSMGMEVTVTVT